MIKVYLLTAEQLGDRHFDEIPVAELQMEALGLSLAEFQQNFNKGNLDASTQFIKFVSI